VPYSYPNNIPRPARNWTSGEQKKCIAAANAVLREGGSEQDAIFACIRAAGKTKNPGGEGSAMPPQTDVWVDIFNASKVLKGEPVCLVPLMEQGYHRGGMKREPITPEVLAALAHNFENRAKSGYYLEQVPLNVEHDELGGAIGSIQSVELRDDGVYAVFDLTPKGKKKLEEGEFAYLSPEIRWHTEDVVSGQDIGPTLAGAAATNYPFWGDRTAMYSDRAVDRLGKEYPVEMRFANKMGALVEQFRGLVALATRSFQGGDTSNGPGGTDSDGNDPDDSQQEVTMPGNQEGNELQIPQEFLDRMSALEDQAEQYGRQLQERDETIQTQRQEIDALNLARVSDRFTARAEGFTAIGAENGDLASELTWLYLVDPTEDRTHFAFFDGLLETLDNALGESAAFQEQGRVGEQQTQAEAFGRIDALISKLAKERGISAAVGSQEYQELAREVLSANPGLYGEHRRSTLGSAANVPA
jgi:hypothetical protein